MLYINERAHIWMNAQTARQPGLMKVHFTDTIFCLSVLKIRTFPTPLNLTIASHMHV